MACCNLGPHGAWLAARKQLNSNGRGWVRAGLESLRVRIAYGMFDTRGRIDPFSPDSPLKLIRVEQFPADFFFVLRVVQVRLHRRLLCNPEQCLLLLCCADSAPPQCRWCRCHKKKEG